MGQSLCESQGCAGRAGSISCCLALEFGTPQGRPRQGLTGRSPIVVSLPFLKMQMNPPVQDTQAMWAAPAGTRQLTLSSGKALVWHSGMLSFRDRRMGLPGRSYYPPCGGSLALLGAFTQAIWNLLRRPQSHLGLRSVRARPLEATGVADRPRGGIQAWSSQAVVLAKGP